MVSLSKAVEDEEEEALPASDLGDLTTTSSLESSAVLFLDDGTVAPSLLAVAAA